MERKLHINYTKTKIIIFSKGEAIRYVFTMNSNDIEIVNEYKYLGVYLVVITLSLPPRNI